MAYATPLFASQCQLVCKQTYPYLGVLCLNFKTVIFPLINFKHLNRGKIIIINTYGFVQREIEYQATEEPLLDTYNAADFNGRLLV